MDDNGTHDHDGRCCEDRVRVRASFGRVQTSMAANRRKLPGVECGGRGTPRILGLLSEATLRLNPAKIFGPCCAAQYDNRRNHGQCATPVRRRGPCGWSLVWNAHWSVHYSVEAGRPMIDRPTDLIQFAKDRKFRTILADPPWRFNNRTGKMAPEHRRLTRYETLTTGDISKLPVEEITLDVAHLYLWVPNALLAEGLAVVQSWGFTYKANIVWHKIRKDGGPDGRGVGFYFRNVTEMILFGVRGKGC